jgi:RsmE family RNA methyltransferase
MVVRSPPSCAHLSKIFSFTISSGGGWCECRFHKVGSSFELKMDSDVHVCSSMPSLSIAFSPVKGGGGGHDWLVQKLTEIGVADIYPLLPTQRCAASRFQGFVSRESSSGSDHSGTNMRRLLKISREASMQSRRVFLPTIHAPTTLEQLSKIPATAIADPSGAPLTSAHRFIIIGPEGGWAAHELALFHERVSLGDSILRSETAGVVAAALMVAAQRSAGHLGQH